jgi:hypothetical protein
MHVEVIGCTSAGKSSLVRGMLAAAFERGQDFVTGDDLALGRLSPIVGNEFVRRRLIDLPALIASVGAFRTHGELIRLVLRLSRTAPGALTARLNLARNALRKIGLREIVTSRPRPGRTVLVDNEGVLQAAHNLFVHVAEAADVDDAALLAFLRLAPLPDVVVYRRQPEAELVARTLRRGHKRVPGGSPAAARRFVARAVRVFETVAADPGVASRLVVLEAEGGARLGAETRTTAELESLRAIVETGADLARVRHAATHPEGDRA